MPTKRTNPDRRPTLADLTRDAGWLAANAISPDDRAAWRLYLTGLTTAQRLTQ